MDPSKSFEDNMNIAFKKLGFDIIPNDHESKNANICTDNIVKLLQTKSKFKIGQACVAGSTGKKTTIFNSDVDCVLFINDETPPFQKVLGEFEDILSMTDAFQIRDVHLTKYSIRFKVHDLDFDLLPAANFAVNCQNGDGDQLSEDQHRKTLDFIKRDPEKLGYLYSGSLAKASVSFMKRQDAFVHEMVRLAKFWFKTLYFFDEHTSGAKSLIELIAVYTATKERDYNTCSYLRCFGQILKQLSQFDELNVVFEMEYKFTEHQVLDNTRPRLIDAVNPYNNFAKNWSEKSIKLIKAYANETYCRIQFLANNNIIHLNILFEPQPMHLPFLSEIFPKSSGKFYWLVGTIAYNSLPDLKIRNNKFLEDFRLRNGLEFLKNYFRFATYSVMASSNYSANDVQRSIQNLIERFIYNKKLAWSPSTEKHEDFDVTFTIPYSNGSAIQISYRL